MPLRMRGNAGLLQKISMIQLPFWKKPWSSNKKISTSYWVFHLVKEMRASCCTLSEGRAASTQKGRLSRRHALVPPPNGVLRGETLGPDLGLVPASQPVSWACWQSRLHSARARIPGNLDFEAVSPGPISTNRQTTTIRLSLWGWHPSPWRWEARIAASQGGRCGPSEQPPAHRVCRPWG